MASPARPLLACPRCGAPSAPAALDCGRCGIVYSKFDPSRARPRAPSATPAALRPAVAGSFGDVPGPAVEDARGVSHPRALLAGRLVLWGGLAAWTALFASHSFASNYAGESFLHLVNLVFHEAGHVIFAPFGQFVMVLGGSLLQVLVPLACAADFIRRRDAFGATVGLWWAGQSLLDLAPYIGDARALRLVLIGGRTGAEVEGHDWEYLLGALGWLHHDVALARVAHAAGLAVMALSLCVGAWVLWRQLRPPRASGRSAIRRRRGPAWLSCGPPTRPGGA